MTLPPHRIVHHDPAGVHLTKAVGAQLTAIDQGEGESIRKYGTELLHYVECEAGAVRAVPMKVADLGSRPCASSAARMSWVSSV
jgi:hypothetical protein